MLKVLQVAIIPMLLCANLLGDEYGVEKYPTLLGKSIAWGMASKDATSAMAKKGFKFHEKTEKREQIFDCFYKGRFLGSNAVVLLTFFVDNLIFMEISLGLTKPITLPKKPLTLRPHTRPLQTALKLKNSMAKQYGKHSTEVFIERPRGKNRGDGWVSRVENVSENYVTRDEALSENFKDIYYALRYKTPKKNIQYMSIHANNYGTLQLNASGPAGVGYIDMMFR